MKVFVYGTLKRGYHNNRVMTQHEASKFLKEDRIKGTMLSLGGFPGVIEGDTWVKGEVWEVDDNAIQSMDRLEGHPTWYRREATTTEGGDEVQYYRWLGQRGNRQVIEGGEWTRD